MAYNGKTNWVNNEIVEATDINRIEQGVVDANNHAETIGNPHNTTKADIGLGNVPNLATNDQTVTHTQASTLSTLTSGEKLTAAFGKIRKAITDLISHIGSANPHSNSYPKTGGEITGGVRVKATDPSIELNSTLGSASGSFNMYEGGNLSGIRIMHDAHSEGIVQLILDGKSVGGRKACISYNINDEHPIYTTHYFPHISGTYIGNGAVDRVINLGFEPSAVYVGYEEYVGTSFVTDSEGQPLIFGGFAVTGVPAKYRGLTNAVTIKSNGFEVYNESTNKSNYTYVYIAFR